jgi:hypothetical protein
MAQTEPNRAAPQQQESTAPAVPQRDGSHDFDFLIGDWKAHARALRNRLDDSNNPKGWVDQEGISNHKKLLDSNANFEIRQQAHKNWRRGADVCKMQPTVYDTASCCSPSHRIR